MQLLPLTTGAGVATEYNLDWVPQLIVVGDVGDLPDVRGIVASVGGDTFQRIELGNANVLNALAQFGNKIADGGNNRNQSVFTISDGFIGQQTFTLTLTNNGVATPIVYAYSTNKSRNGNVVNGGTQVILPSQQKLLSNFDVLAFEDDNFSRADVNFADGHSEAQLTLEEMKSLLSLTGNLPSVVESEAVVMVDNRLGNIASVVLYAGAGGNLTVASQKV